jgi:ribosomal protein S18 acetylase RimI-like enzyme
MSGEGAEHSRPALVPRLIAMASPEYLQLAQWPFRDAYVPRMLRHILPMFELEHETRVWVFHDETGAAVGFGTLEIVAEYPWLVAPPFRRHFYVPLLAVHPAAERRGYGKAILKHLIAEASLPRQDVEPMLILDVYAENARAIGLYDRAGFRKLTDAAVPDPAEGGRGYWILGMRLDDPRGS